MKQYINEKLSSINRLWNEKSERCKSSKNFQGGKNFKRETFMNESFFFLNFIINGWEWPGGKQFNNKPEC
jgi:hypothetical protein